MHQGVSPGLNSGGGWGREVRPDTLETKVAALKGKFSISMIVLKNGGTVKSHKVISSPRIVLLTL